MSKSKRDYNPKPSRYYIYVEIKILVDFHICNSVHLNVSPVAKNSKVKANLS